MTLYIQNLIITPTSNKNKWVHSVIFKPQAKIQLTRSSYKVTSFLDFQPFLQGFHSVNEYLNNLMVDINNPSYYQRLVTPFAYVQIDTYANDSHINKFLNSPTCHHCPYAGQYKMKFKQFHAEI